MDIQHPDIDRIERTGYPDREYIEWEREQEELEDEND